MIQRLEAGNIKQAVMALRTDGVSVIEGIAPRKIIEKLYHEIKGMYPEYFELSDTYKDQFEIGDRRFTYPIIYYLSNNLDDIVISPHMIPLLDEILGPSWVVEVVGVVISFPGAKTQTVHRDGGLLFPETGVDRVLPTCSLTFACPLVPIDEVNGRTAFYLGTHRMPVDDDKHVPEAVDVGLGSCLLWDFRVAHFGEANRGSTPRPMLYVTYCRPFWIDDQNFVPGVNAKLLASRIALDSMKEGIRRRFVRAQIID